MMTMARNGDLTLLPPIH